MCGYSMSKQREDNASEAPAGDGLVELVEQRRHRLRLALAQICVLHEEVVAQVQGLTLLRFSAQRGRYLWDR